MGIYPFKKLEHFGDIVEIINLYVSYQNEQDSSFYCLHFCFSKAFLTTGKEFILSGIKFGFCLGIQMF